MARKSARYLAPVALIAVAVAIALIVRARTESHHATAAPPAHRLPVTSHASTKAKAKPRYYVVKPGDSLSVISVRTKVTIAELETLNPSVNPAALQSGERLRLSP